MAKTLHLLQSQRFGPCLYFLFLLYYCILKNIYCRDISCLPGHNSLYKWYPCIFSFLIMVYHNIINFGSCTILRYCRPDSAHLTVSGVSPYQRNAFLHQIWQYWCKPKPFSVWYTPEAIKTNDYSNRFLIMVHIHKKMIRKYTISCMLIWLRIAAPVFVKVPKKRGRNFRFKRFFLTLRTRYTLRISPDFSACGVCNSSHQNRRNWRSEACAPGYMCGIASGRQ